MRARTTFSAVFPPRRGQLRRLLPLILLKLYTLMKPGYTARALRPGPAFNGCIHGCIDFAPYHTRGRALSITFVYTNEAGRIFFFGRPAPPRYKVRSHLRDSYVYVYIASYLIRYVSPRFFFSANRIYNRARARACHLDCTSRAR